MDVKTMDVKTMDVKRMEDDIARLLQLASCGYSPWIGDKRPLPCPPEVKCLSTLQLVRVEQPWGRFVASKT